MQLVTAFSAHCIGPAGLPSDEALDATELRFLEDFCNLLTTAHYRLLTEEEWQTATDEEFTASYFACLCTCSVKTATLLPLCTFGKLQHQRGASLHENRICQLYRPLR